MKYLPRKLIKEEIDKINPKLDFSVALSHNRFGLFEDKSYVIRIEYKKFRSSYGAVIPIRRDVVRGLNKRELGKILNHQLSEINKDFISYNGRKKIKHRTIEAQKDWLEDDECYD